MKTGMSKTLGGTKRVRLGHKRYKSKSSHMDSQKASEMGRKASETAKRDANGKKITGYRYKELVSTYHEHGIDPKKVVAEVDHSKGVPLFVKNPMIRKSIIKLIEEGNPHITVCRYVGINHSTFIKWLQIGSQGLYPEYTKFHRSVSKAEAKAERRLLKTLKNHERTDWRVSSWQLERRWPENWARRDGNRARVEVNNTITINQKENLGKTVLVDEQAKELARRMIDHTRHSRDADDVDFTEE